MLKKTTKVVKEASFRSKEYKAELKNYRKGDFTGRHHNFWNGVFLP
jgi:hypothetical protein